MLSPSFRVEQRVRSHHPKEALANLPNAHWQMRAEGGMIWSMNAESSRKELSRARTNWEQIRTYADLQEQLHRDLLAQNPEWIDADGNCPKCDSYDQRLAKLIAGFQFTARKSVGSQHEQQNYAFAEQ
jgi:hypothetical protein